MPRYSFLTNQITNTGFNQWQRILGGDSRRKSLVISSGANGTIWVATSPQPNQVLAWMHVAGPGTVVAPYRDFGPLIQTEIYVMSSSVGQVIFSSSIFEIPD